MLSQLMVVDKESKMERQTGASSVEMLVLFSSVAVLRSELLIYDSIHPLNLNFSKCKAFGYIL